MITHNINYFIISSTFLSATLTFWNWSIVFDSDTMFCFKVMLEVFSKRQDRSSLKNGFYLYNFVTERTGLKDAHKTEVFLPGEGNSTLVLNFCIFLFSYIFYIFTFIYILFKSKIYISQGPKIYPSLPTFSGHSLYFWWVKDECCAGAESHP